LLVCVGSIAFDTIETPEGRADEVLGGSATYFGYAASLYGPVGLVGVVGDDFPDAHLAEFRQRGMNTDGVQRLSGRTFRWAGRYLDDMNVRQTTNLELNVFGQFDPVLPESYRGCEYCFLANGSPAIQHRVLDQLKAPKMVLADTMNHWIADTRSEVLEMLERVDGVIINDEEAEMLSGRKNLVADRQEGRPRLYGAGRGPAVSSPCLPGGGGPRSDGCGRLLRGGVHGLPGQHGRPVVRRAASRAPPRHGRGEFLERLRSLTRERVEERIAEFTEMVRV